MRAMTTLHTGSMKIRCRAAEGYEQTRKIFCNLAKGSNVSLDMSQIPSFSAPSARRTFLTLCGSAAAASVALLLGCSGETSAATTVPFRLSDAEWRKRLSPEAYYVLRRAGTEAPYSSALNNEHRRGAFICAGCDLPLFASSTKFDSGTGWPSFYDHLPRAIGETTDRSLLMARTEVHCARCAGHLGHVFNDGPVPTGLRYCMNGVAMKFVAGR
jgi:peptide-methionine (R)-S-oxide reductase